MPVPYASVASMGGRERGQESRLLNGGDPIKNLIVVSEGDFFFQIYVGEGYKRGIAENDKTIRIQFKSQEHYNGKAESHTFEGPFL